MITEIRGDRSFEVLDADKYIFFYFGATWCGPCQLVLPKLTELSEKYDPDMIEFYKIDIDLAENKTFCDKCEIKAVPAFLLFKGRKFISRIKGNNIPGVIKMINNNIFPVTNFEVPNPTQVTPTEQIQTNPFVENRKVFNKDRIFQ